MSHVPDYTKCKSCNENEVMEYFDKCEDCLNEEATRIECEEKHWGMEYWTK